MPDSALIDNSSPRKFPPRHTEMQPKSALASSAKKRLRHETVLVEDGLDLPRGARAFSTPQSASTPSRRSRASGPAGRQPCQRPRGTQGPKADRGPDKAIEGIT